MRKTYAGESVYYAGKEYTSAVIPEKLMADLVKSGDAVEVKEEKPEEVKANENESKSGDEGQGDTPALRKELENAAVKLGITKTKIKKMTDSELVAAIDKAEEDKAGK